MSTSTTNQDLELEESSNETTPSSSEWESASDEETTTTTSSTEEEVTSPTTTPATSTSSSPSISNRKRRRESTDDGEEERTTTSLPSPVFSRLSSSAISISSRRMASISSRRTASSSSTASNFTIFEDPLDRIIDLTTPPSSPRPEWADAIEHRETIRSPAEERRLMEIQIHFAGYDHHSSSTFRHDNDENDDALLLGEYTRQHDSDRDALGDNPYLDGRGAW